MGDTTHPSLPSMFNQLNTNVNLYNNSNTSNQQNHPITTSVLPPTTNTITPPTNPTTTNTNNIISSGSITNKNNMKIPFNLNFDPVEIDNNSKSILKNYPSIQQQQQLNSNQNHFQQSNNLNSNTNNLQPSQSISIINNNIHSNLPKKEISKKGMKLDEKVYVPVRVCEFCGSSNTPTWRRGPSGKGSLCNACGIKWRLKGKDGVFKQQTPKAPRQPKQTANHQNQSQQQSIPLNKQQIQQHLQKLEHEQLMQQQKQIQKLQQQQKQSQSMGQQQLNIAPHTFDQKFQVQQQYNLPFSNNLPTNSNNPNISSKYNYNELSHGVPQFEYSHIVNPNINLKKRKLDKMEIFDMNQTDKGYFCKYCKKTWPQSSFRNSQQFGAHCSNCSRKPRDELDALKSKLMSSSSIPLKKKSTTEIPQALQNAPLLSRLIHVVENQLLDPNEMNSIREDIEEMKMDLIKRKKRRIDQLSNVNMKLNIENQQIKQNIDMSMKAREIKTKEFIDQLKNEVEKRLSQKELFYLPESIHTVPFSVSTKSKITNITSKNSPLLISTPTNSKKPSMIPLSPELIHSPHHNPVKFLEEKSGGKHFSIDMPIVQN